LGWWWGLLTLVSGANITVWLWLYHQLHDHPARGLDSASGIEPMLLLSAAYVFGCAFRSILPRADVQRIGASQICIELLTSMGRRRAVDILAAIVIAIVMAIVMVMAVSRVHVEVTMVPMAVSHANANANVADLNSDVFRDDHWFVAGAQRAGKCRHR
jgi:hypothetical protein